MTPILKYFKFEHLPEGRLRDVSKAFCDQAKEIEEHIPNNFEKSAGLRKLLEAKDCIVRASLP